MMRYSSRSIRSRNAILPVLAVVALILLILPTAWTGGLMSLVQVIVPLQDGANSGLNLLSNSESDAPNDITLDDYQQLVVENEALERRVVVLANRITKLQDEVDLLQATRLHGGPEGGLGAHGRLIPAKVVGQDILPWRSSQWVNSGSLQGIDRGAAVVSKLDIFGGEGDGLRNGLSVLLGEVLVGVIEQVGTHTSRVALLSDLAVQRKVQIGRLSESGFETIDGFYWLQGRGRGVMEIEQVDRRLVRDGSIKEGDIVLSDPADPILPSAMVIGRIVKIRHDRDNPLLSILTVESSVPHDTLRRVYVYDPADPWDEDTQERG